MTDTPQNDAPEVIWLDDIERMHAFQSSEDCEGCYGGKGTPYTRTDTHTAALAERDAVIADLVEALENIASRSQTQNLLWWQAEARAVLSRAKGET